MQEQAASSQEPAGLELAASKWRGTGDLRRSIDRLGAEIIKLGPLSAAHSSSTGSGYKASSMINGVGGAAPLRAPSVGDPHLHAWLHQDASGYGFGLEAGALTSSRSRRVAKPVATISEATRVISQERVRGRERTRDSQESGHGSIHLFRWRSESESESRPGPRRTRSESRRRRRHRHRHRMEKQNHGDKRVEREQGTTNF